MWSRVKSIFTEAVTNYLHFTRDLSNQWYPLSNKWHLKVLIISSKASPFDARYLKASSLLSRIFPPTKYRPLSFTMTPCSQAKSKASDTRQIPFPKFILNSAFVFEGASLFFTTCTHIPSPVAWQQKYRISDTWSSEIRKYYRGANKQRI